MICRLLAIRCRISRSRVFCCFEQLLGMFQQPLLLLLRDAARRDVLDREQDHSGLAVILADRPGIELDGAHPQIREILLEFEVFHRSMLRDHRLEQLAQAGNVPLPVGQARTASGREPCSGPP